MGMEFDGLTDRIIGAAIEVHKGLGPGFLESIYENALAASCVLRSYLRAADREHGLLLNFAKPTLEIKRVSTKRSF